MGSYHECIWDHAPGVLLVKEAGGTVTDCLGAPLNFGMGRHLSANIGVIAASSAELHAALVATTRAKLGMASK